MELITKRKMKRTGNRNNNNNNNNNDNNTLYQDFEHLKQEDKTKKSPSYNKREWKEEKKNEKEEIVSIFSPYYCGLVDNIIIFENNKPHLFDSLWIDSQICRFNRRTSL